MRVKKFVFFLLLFIIQGAAHGQLKEAFAKGTIELSSGQILNGLIKEAELGGMNYKVKFKSSPSDKTITVYDTTQVKAFSVSGDEFKIFHLKVNNRADSISIFAKLILSGKASLYKTVYKSNDLFIIKIDTNIYVLQNDKLEEGALSTAVTSFYFRNNFANAMAGYSIPAKTIEALRFNEKDFIAIISAYNQSFGSANKLMSSKQKAAHFLIASAGGMYKSNKNNEFFLQLIYRTYFPKISRSTSINLGINYMRYKKTEYVGDWLYGREKTLTSSIASLPFYVQQNILNKKIRPHFAAGFSLAYYKVVDENGDSQIQDNFPNHFGVGLLFGAGVEADVYKGLMLKAEYRHEVFNHMLLFGIGYNFSKH